MAKNIACIIGTVTVSLALIALYTAVTTEAALWLKIPGAILWGWFVVGKISLALMGRD